MIVRLFASVLLLGSGVCLLRANRLRLMGWMHWSTSPAVVQSGRIDRTGDQEYGYAASLFYSYHYASVTYYGSCTFHFTTPQEAFHYLESSATARLLARYQAELPEESCLCDSMFWRM